MQLEELDAATKSAVERVASQVTEILGGADSPHLRATSQSFVPDGVKIEEALGGGNLSGPGRPPFTYDKRELMELHREALLTSWRNENPIHNLIVRGARNAVGEPWAVDIRCVSQAEHDALRAQRSPIDQAVTEELRAMSDVPAAWIMFGRENRRPLRLARKTNSVEELELQPSLLAHFERAEALYRARGLELVTLVWHLEREVSITEYFE